MLMSSFVLTLTSLEIFGTIRHGETKSPRKIAIFPFQKVFINDLVLFHCLFASSTHHNPITPHFSGLGCGS